jgi:hypothetical protein
MDLFPWLTGLAILGFVGMALMFAFSGSELLQVALTN